MVRNGRREDRVRIATKAGLVAGGVVGLAVGAGLLMMPQGKQMRSMIEKGAAAVKNNVSGWMK